ncbi:MAG: hypothetical protein PHP82_01085 [Candidatus ainarchaeum sp.]|nr:hypothetical protein [Candidatus ainarchaeum sp.]
MTQQINEQQLIQIAQREERVLQTQQNFLQNLKNALKETHETIEGLKEIQKNEKNVFFRIGQGVLIEAEIKNKDKCKRIFSENGYKETKTEDTIKWLEKRKGNLEQQAQKVQTEIIKNEQKLVEIINMIKQIQQEKSKNISVK